MEVISQHRKTLTAPRPRRKVKTGCKTCKIRRIKCDEGKPVCLRCRTTGRKCDGYGIWGGGGNGYEERCGAVKQQKSLSDLLERNMSGNMAMEELRYLQLFRFRYIHTVSGWFGSDFWAKTVLPSTASEPAILHAVIALSAAHRCEFRKSETLGAPERFMLQQYSKAIQLLQPILGRHDRAAITVILITCQVFTFLEYLRGKHHLAEAHLRNCLRLLKDMHSTEHAPYGVLVLKPSSHTKLVEKEIIQRLATLHMQANLFGGRLSDLDLILQPQEFEVPYPVFAHAEEAKDCIDKLLHGTILFSQIWKKRAEAGEDMSEMFHLKSVASKELAAWLHTYLRTASEFGIRMFGVKRSSTVASMDEPLGFGSRSLSDGMNAREPLAYRLLLNYHTMATIMCNCVQTDESELKYEAHTVDFLCILENAIEIWKVYALAREIPGNVELSNSISEYGYIPPLYYTALKCRVHRIRAHAIMMLNQIHYREGAWDSILAANIAKKVMQLEEEGFATEEESRDDFTMPDIPSIENMLVWTPPEHKLFHDVQVEISDESGDRALIVCKRTREDGSLETIKCHVESEPWLAS